MAETFYSILTNIGKAKIAMASALGTDINITQFAVGDGNGAYYNPTEDQTALKHEVWRGNATSINVDSQNPNWIVAESIIIASEGGFMIREAGIFDADGDMIAVGKYPETYKPLVEEGSSKDLNVKMIIEVSNASNVTLKINPSVLFATKDEMNHVKEDVENKIIVTEEDIPVDQRQKGSFYFVVTDKAPTSAAGEVKVSPTMGIKIL